MSVEIRVPALPESVADATILSWHKKAGDRIKQDENLVDLETDKVVLEVPAPAGGVLAEIRHGEGAVVNAGDVLAVIDASAKPEKTSTARSDAATPAASVAQTSSFFAFKSSYCLISSSLVAIYIPPFYLLNAKESKNLSRL